jgi:hypothetical protein
LNVTTFGFNLISGMAVGIEFLSKEVVGVFTIVIDLLIVRVLIQHGPAEDFED